MASNYKNLIVIPNMSGAEGDVKVTISNATVQDRWDHSLQFPDPEFGGWLLEQVFSREKVVAKRTGLLVKNYLCSSCQTELNPSLSTNLNSKYEFTFMDFPPFSVTFEMPSVVCPRCNKIRGIDLKGALQYQISQAIVQAFESKNIKIGEGIQQAQCQFYIHTGVQCSREALKGRKHCWMHDTRFVVTYSSILIVLLCLGILALGLYPR
jgi:hypothetical protein